LERIFTTAGLLNEVNGKYTSVLLLVAGILNAILAGLEIGIGHTFRCVVASGVSISLLLLSFSMRLREVP